MTTKRFDHASARGGTGAGACQTVPQQTFHAGRRSWRTVPGTSSPVLRFIPQRTQRSQRCLLSGHKAEDSLLWLVCLLWPQPEQSCHPVKASRPNPHMLLQPTLVCDAPSACPDVPSPSGSLGACRSTVWISQKAKSDRLLAAGRFPGVRYTVRLRYEHRVMSMNA